MCPPVLVGAIVNVTIKLIIERWTPSEIKLHKMNGPCVFLFEENRRVGFTGWIVGVNGIVETLCVRNRLHLSVDSNYDDWLVYRVLLKSDRQLRHWKINIEISAKPCTRVWCCCYLVLWLYSCSWNVVDVDKWPAWSVFGGHAKLRGIRWHCVWSQGACNASESVWNFSYLLLIFKLSRDIPPNGVLVVRSTDRKCQEGSRWKNPVFISRVLPLHGVHCLK